MLTIQSLWQTSLIFSIWERARVVYDELLDLYQKAKTGRLAAVKSFLEQAAHIPGIYVPSFMMYLINEDGTIAAFDTEL